MAGWAKRLGFGLVGLAALIAVTLTILAARTRLPGEELTPAGVRRNTLQYVKMRDAVPIALVSPVLRHWAQRCYFFRYPAHISLLCLPMKPLTISTRPISGPRFVGDLHDPCPPSLLLFPFNAFPNWLSLHTHHSRC
jgi:hypothetical protein